MQQIDSVLLIDDDDISNFVTSTLLKNSGVTQNITICKDGLEAMQWLQTNFKVTQKCPGLILLDLNMPAMNGFDFLEAYRKFAGINAPSVIIVLSTSQAHQDLERLQQFPEVEVYLHKPLTEENIQYIVNTYFS